MAIFNNSSLFETVALPQILSKYIFMLSDVVVHTIMCWFGNESLFPFRFIFPLLRPYLCLLRTYVLTSWAYVPLYSKFLPLDRLPTVANESCILVA